MPIVIRPPKIFYARLEDVSQCFSDFGAIKDYKNNVEKIGGSLRKRIGVRYFSVIFAKDISVETYCEILSHRLKACSHGYLNLYTKEQIESGVGIKPQKKAWRVRASGKMYVKSKDVSDYFNAPSRTHHINRAISRIFGMSSSQWEYSIQTGYITPPFSYRINYVSYGRIPLISVPRLKRENLK